MRRFRCRCGGICLISIGVGVLLALVLPLRAVLLLSGLALIVLGISNLHC